ncbi:alpha/beta fold hydrolase [Shewanella sp.]|uniref:alpha/beta fold hydrolase n=1 Tax=Shewanella sp. TaxID=50422 RepID=UPI004047A564
MAKWFVLVLLSLLMLPVQANWLNDINRKVRALGEPEAEIQVAKPLSALELADYPPQYQYQRVMVPSHDTPLFVLQAGLEHQDTVVLVHGLGDLASKDWLTVIPALAAQYHVVAIDLPGFGLSQGAVFTYSPKEYAKVIDWVIKQYRHPGQVSLVGHSMGAAISLYYANQYPGRIGQLVLVDAAGILDRTAYIKHLSTRDNDKADLPQGVRRVIARVDNFADKMLEKTGTGFDPTRLFSNDSSLRNMTIGEQTNMNAALALMEQNFSVLNYQQMPTTQIIWGAQDTVAPLRTAHALQHVLPLSQLHVISDAGHVPMKSHPQRFNSLLLASLQGLTTARPARMTNVSQRIGRCFQDDHTHFSGQYQHIILNDCKLVRFDNLDTQQLTLTDSIVSMSKSRIGTAGHTMVITRSVMTATDTDIVGRINSNRSRFDFAGVSFYGESPVFISQASTRLVLSLTRIITPTQSTRLGGSYVLAEQCLESMLSY